MINNEGTVIGIITTIDVLYNIKDEKDINYNTIRYTMTFNPTAIKQNKDIEDQTVGVKDKNGISMSPVLEDYERIIGICSRSDILKETLKDRFVVIGTKKPTTTITIIGEG
jgi:predicted transcriptional regulator